MEVENLIELVRMTWSNGMSAKNASQLCPGEREIATMAAALVRTAPDAKTTPIARGMRGTIEHDA